MDDERTVAILVMGRNRLFVKVRSHKFPLLFVRFRLFAKLLLSNIVDLILFYC